MDLLSLSIVTVMTLPSHQKLQLPAGIERYHHGRFLPWRPCSATCDGEGVKPSGLWVGGVRTVMG